jgi:beta-glucosidase
MKKLSLLFIAFLTTALFADLTTVTVPPEMLHAPGGDLGVMGKVSYTLDISRDDLNLLAYDSIFVSLEIVPAGGGTPLQLDKVEGAVGVLHILPKQPTRDIFFTYKGTPTGQYIARVKVTAIETDVMKKTKAMVKEATVAQMVPLFNGVAADKVATGSDGSFFEQAGITTASGTLKNIRTADGPHGVHMRAGKLDATCFLTCGGIACTWDVNSAFEQGVAMGEEFRADGRNVCLGPAVNIIIHPQGGRDFEYYSEDSYLAAKMAASAVKGLRTRGVIAAIKHFAVNNKEAGRETISAEIDERSLEELFLPQYKECVVNGGALGVMTAYNKVNGQYCTDSKYLVEDILRNTWGFLGYTMSDWNALVNSEAAAAQYGADQRLPDRKYSEASFSNATYARNKAKHVIYANGKVGLLDPAYTPVAYQNTFMSQDKRNLIRKIGAKALVLAKNDGKVLPLPKVGKKIYITGPLIDIARPESQYLNKYEHQVARLGGGDSKNWESSLVFTPDNRRISPEQGIKEYLKGLSVDGVRDTLVSNIGLADYIVVACGPHGEGESMDRDDMLVYKDEEFVKGVLNNSSKKPSAKTIVLYTGGSASLPGSWSTADAILICFGPGEEQGYSIADVLFGDVCPGGKLNVTFPKTASQVMNFTSSANKLQYNKSYEAHGYFKVDYMNQEPLFAFGHGLSYTTFEYSNLQVYPATIKKGDRVYVSVNVANTGTVKGDEVVQLYLSLPSGTIPVRKQDLRGFNRITLDPGTSQKVTFTLDPEDMSYFKVGAAEFDGTGTWDILTGEYKVRVGTSSKINPAPDQPSVAGSFTVN